MSRDATPWHARAEVGHELGIWLMERIARTFGRRAAHVVVAPVAAYFFMKLGMERRASREFLDRALGRRATLGERFRHFYWFALVAVDRVLMLAPGTHGIPMRSSGERSMEETLREGRGCILISAHFGSFEASRQMGLTHPRMRLRLLLDRNLNRRMMSMLERIDPAFAHSIIDAGGAPRELTLRIGECLREGEWVGWLADRHRGAERTVSVDFLGAAARFPASPFIIAQLFRVPVFMILAAFDGRGYEISVEQLTTGEPISRESREAAVHECVARFAARLDHHVRRSPYNWFNFYDFWNA